MIVSPEVDLFLCVLAPFVAAVLAPLLRPVFGDWTGALLALVPLSVCAYLTTLIGPVATGETIRVAIDWIPSLGITLSLLVDGLSLTFALLISGIGALILIYSGSYLHSHPHLGRFLGFLLAFMGAMLGLVLADNTIALYGFWELTTVTSFLLIGFDHTRTAARRAAIQALVITNIGGLALLVAGIVLHGVFGSWDLSTLRGLDAAVQGSSVYPVVLGAVLLAAFTKSAQFPLHFWLPAAMQAPTPVSAYLHSATMVQGGVYLLARTTPILAGTEAWTLLLMSFGGATLLWGGIAALRQTDIKQLLAQSTVAALGMLVLLIGIGTEEAIAAAVVFFVAHAFYKAALFLIGGIIDHETGARDLTAVGGLRDRMAATFIAAVLAAASMIGLPPSIGFLGKEMSYAAQLGLNWPTLLALMVMIAGNALMTAVALAVALKPFMGPLLATPRDPHEAPIAMLLGPATFAVMGIAGGWATAWLAGAVVTPAASAILLHEVHPHVPAGIDITHPALLLSLLTWVLGGILFWQYDRIRSYQQRVATHAGWTFELGFDRAMFGLVRASGAITRTLQHGRLELYLVLTFALFTIALVAPMLLQNDWPRIPSAPRLAPHEWGAVALTALGLIAVLMTRTRVLAIIALGIQGVGVALIFLLFGAPDLSFTQLMVEILSVVIFALVMTRLNLDTRDARPLEDVLRDGGLALLCGVGVMLVLMRVLQHPFDPRLSTFFAEHSVEVAHGRNIVNVILVDFRGLDTLGEISVVMAAGVAVMVLLAGRMPSPSTGERPKRSRTRQVTQRVAT